MLRKLVLLTLSSLWPLCGPAQDLLQGVDPDVRAALVFEGVRADRNISRDVPAALNGFRAPAGFEFVGSSIDDFVWLSAYKTELPGDDAEERVATALIAAGWQEYRPWSAGGFVNIHMPDPMLCRDEQIVTVMARPVAELTYVLIRSSRALMDCSGELEASPAVDMLMRFASRHMPLLSLPTGAEAIETDPNLVGGSSSPTNAIARNRLRLDPDRGNRYLADEYAGQLRNQDWDFQGEWATGEAAGSSWLATREGDVRLSGLLQVVTLGNGEYDVKFLLDVIR
jgi:hypothetical protein